MTSLLPYVLMVPATDNFTSCSLNQKIGCTIIRIINRNLWRGYKMCIRKAITDDLSRVAEIYVFNNRINFFPSIA